MHRACCSTPPPRPPVIITPYNLPHAHAQGQLSLLLHATAAPPELYIFEPLPAERRLPPVDGLAGGRLPHGSPNRAWLSRDLLEVGVREGGREGGGRCGF